VLYRHNHARKDRSALRMARGARVRRLFTLWLAQNEGAKFWLSCLTDLKNRGLNDIFVACVDGRTGFPEAIRAAYPQTKVQLGIVHLVRAALK
jgi:putative transposase